MSDTRQPIAYFTFRVLFSLIFLVAGLKHLLSPEQIATRLAHAPLAHLATAIAPAHLLVIAAGVVLFAGGLALLLGAQTRLAALALIVVLVPITLTVQVGNAEGSGPLFKNIALLGGLIQFAAAGAGALSLDARFRQRGRVAATVGIAAVALLAAPLAQAKSPAPASKERVAFLVQAPKPLKVVLHTAQQMLAGQEFAAAEVTVVVCGAAVTSIKTEGEHAALVQASRRAGVRVAACGLTLQETGIAREDLSPSVEIVPNGLTELLRLQSLGFRTVEL